MTLTFRDEKGSPLSAAEADANIHDLDDRIQALVDNPPTAVGISNIAVQGSQVIFYKTDGTHFGPFPLPYVTMHIRADFDSTVAQSYAVLDLIPVPGVGLFLSKADNDYDVGEPFNPNRLDGNGNALYVKVFGEDTYIYDFDFSLPNKPGLGVPVDDYIGSHMFLRDVYYPANFTGSKAKLRTAPDADLVYEITNDDVTIGTLTFPAGEVDGVFASDDPQQYSDGLTLGLKKIADNDVSAKGFRAAFSGIRGLIPVTP